MNNRRSKRTPRPGRARRENLAGWIFIAPMLIGLTVLTVIPTIITLILSFADWSFIAGIDKIRFVGLDNYAKLLKDDVFRISLRNNLILLLVVPVQMIVSLVLAVIIDRVVYLKNWFKAVFFLPYISSIVAVAIVFQLLFHPSYGPINKFLAAAGAKHPPLWLADVHYALPSVMMIMVWVGIGFCSSSISAFLPAVSCSGRKFRAITKRHKRKRSAERGIQASGQPADRVQRGGIQVAVPVHVAFDSKPDDAHDQQIRGGRRLRPAHRQCLL